MSQTLDQLEPGSSGKIVSLTDIERSGQLAEMGLLPGTKVTVVKHAPLGDPIEIKVRGYNLSLRRAEAAIVEVELE